MIVYRVLLEFLDVILVRTDSFRNEIGQSFAVDTISNSKAVELTVGHDLVNIHVFFCFRQKSFHNRRFGESFDCF